jgi:hypothetical protein
MSTSFNFFGSVKSDARYAITLLIVYRSLHRNSAIRQINGPPSPSWLFGRLHRIFFRALNVYSCTHLQGI